MAKDRNCCCGLRPQDPNLSKGLPALDKVGLLEKCWKALISSRNLLRSMGSVTTWHQRHQLDERESLRLGYFWLATGHMVTVLDAHMYCPGYRKIQKMIENESCSEIFHASLIRKYSHINLQGACFDPTHCPYMQN